MRTYSLRESEVRIIQLIRQAKTGRTIVLVKLSEDCIQAGHVAPAGQFKDDPPPLLNGEAAKVDAAAAIRIE